MQYHNPTSSQTLSLPELCRAENASIHPGLPYGQWLPVEQLPYPENPEPNAIYDLDQIKVVDGKPVQGWVKIGTQDPMPE